jgi:probable rRNA maturation factor
MPLRIRINVAAELRRPWARIGCDGTTMRRLLRAAVRAAFRARRITDAELSLTLLADAGITDLNAAYLGHDGPTDVIAFALYEPGETPVGDVYIGFDQALRQAERLDIPPDQELLRLAIHGTLHVLGFDHPAAAERETSEMWQLQERILAGVLEP